MIMPVWLSILIILASFFLIGKSAEFLIKGLVNLGKRLRWSEFVTGFIILGLATSAPEFFVALNSGREGVPQLSLGNLLGGIVVLFTLLIGLNALWQGSIPADGKFSAIDIMRLLPRALPFRRAHFFVKDFFLMAGLILFPLLLLVDGELSRIDGLGLLVIYLLFIIHAVYERRTDGWQPPKQTVSWQKIWLRLAAGLAGLLVFSWVIVKQAVFLAGIWQVPAVILGLALLSLGTNLPELVLTFKTRHQHGEVAVGDILGSAVTNVLILGLLAIFYPFRIIAIQPVLIVSISLAAATVLLIIFFQTKNRLERWEGGVLVGVYLVYLFLEMVKL